MEVKVGEKSQNVVDANAPQTLTDVDLFCTEFQEPHFVVPGLIAEGITILAGRPKMGKSMLAENLGLAVARGGKALGAMEVEQAQVLYLALEDNQRRMKSRMVTMQGSNSPTNHIHYAFQWPRADQGGLEQLGNWLKNHPGTKLVIVDTFGRIRSRGGFQGSSYDRDYNDVSAFKKISEQNGAAIVLVHHLRKASSDDCLDLVTGTTGLTGAADSVIVLRRERMSADASLFISGRDTEEKDLALRFDSTSCSWAIVGPAEEYRLSKERQAVVEILKSAGRPLRLSEIATVLGKKGPVVHKHLGGLMAAGIAVQPKYGYYKLLNGSGNNQSVEQA